MNSTGQVKALPGALRLYPPYRQTRGAKSGALPEISGTEASPYRVETKPDDLSSAVKAAPVQRNTAFLLAPSGQKGMTDADTRHPYQCHEKYSPTS